MHDPLNANGLSRNGNDASGNLAEPKAIAGADTTSGKAMQKRMTPGSLSLRLAHNREPYREPAFELLNANGLSQSSNDASGNLVEPKAIAGAGVASGKAMQKRMTPGSLSLASNPAAMPRVIVHFAQFGAIDCMGFA